MTFIKGYASLFSLDYHCKLERFLSKGGVKIAVDRFGAKIPRELTEITKYTLTVSNNFGLREHKATTLNNTMFK